MTAKADPTAKSTASMSLEQVSLGQRVRVVGVRYRARPARREGSGIQPGAVLLCVDRHRDAVVVRTESGRSHRLPLSAASCIAVELLEERW